MLGRDGVVCCHLAANFLNTMVSNANKASRESSSMLTCAAGRLSDSQKRH